MGFYKIEKNMGNLCSMICIGKVYYEFNRLCFVCFFCGRWMWLFIDRKGFRDCERKNKIRNIEKLDVGNIEFRI